jgi:predicted peptidase
VPPATGTAGTISPTLAHGWAVASQDGGHENKDLPAPHQFFLDPQAVTDHAYGSIDVTAQTAKFLIDAYYGQAPDRSYFVGCSTGGRQGMVFSQNFPDYFDGIVAGIGASRRSRLSRRRRYRTPPMAARSSERFTACDRA